MLQKLNERTQGVIAWFIIILIAVTFTLFGLDYYMQSKQSNSVKATVDGQSISMREYDLMYRRLRQQQAPESLTPQLEKQLKQQALQQMLVNEVTSQAAVKNGFIITEGQAKQAILQIPQFQEEGNFSPVLYQQALNYALYTPESFLDEVQQGMLINQYRFAFAGTSFALPSEVNYFIALINQTRSFDYLVISAPQFYAKSEPSEQAIAGYYDKNKLHFMEPEKVAIDYIQLSMPAIAKSITINDVEIQDYYQNNIDSYRKPAKWQIARILLATNDKMDAKQQQAVLDKANNLSQQLKASPDKFSEFMKRYSDDKLSALAQGKQPWITASTHPNAVQEALMSLKKGDVSAPIKTQYGYEIIEVKNYQPSTVTPLADVKEVIKKQLKADKAQRIFSDYSDQLTDLSYQNPDSLSDVASALKLPVLTTELFTREGGAKALTKNKQVIAAAFSDEVLAQGNNSEPVQVGNDSIVVLRVKEHITAKPKPLSEVQASIKQLLIKQEAKQKAQSLGKELLAAQSKETAFAALLKKSELNWQSAKEVKRQASNVSPAITRLAFSIPKTLAGKEDQLKGESLSNGDYIIIKLKSVNPGKLSSVNKDQRKIIEQQIESNKGILDYDLLVASLMKEAKIEKH